MNKAMLMGRLTRDPEVRYSQGANPQAIARYTIAIDRRYRRSGEERQTDFIPCVAFGKSAEFAEKYLHQGTRIVVTGRIQTGSYTNKDGKTVYTTDVIVEEQEFAESKASADSRAANAAQAPAPQAQGNFAMPQPQPVAQAPVTGQTSAVAQPPMPPQMPAQQAPAMVQQAPMPPVPPAGYKPAMAPAQQGGYQPAQPMPPMPAAPQQSTPAPAAAPAPQGIQPGTGYYQQPGFADEYMPAPDDGMDDELPFN